MEEKKYSNLDIQRASIAKRLQIYRKYGYQQAVYLTRSFDDYENHFFSFLIDLNICLLPVYIWALEFVLILTGIISPMYFDLLFYVMYAFLFLSSCVALPLYTANSGGQSIGQQFTGLRLVQRNKRVAPAMKLVLRQLLGFGIPLVLFGYFFSVTGILIWWALNALIVLISPNQQTLFDWIFGLVLVSVQDIKVVVQSDQPQPQTIQVPESVDEPVDEKQEENEISPIDLHIRSSFSDDSSADVEEIMKNARDLGMEVISITDHNCARANDQAVRFAPMYNIQYIPGVEVDTVYNGERIRILGYYIDWKKPIFDEIERNSLKREKEASIARVKAFEKLMHLKIDIDAILSKSRFQTITPADLTYMVFKNERTRRIDLVEKYLEEADMDEQKAKEMFKEEIFGEGGPCHIDTVYPDAVEIIEAIHDAGGLAIVSSWHIDQMKDDTLEGLLDEKIDGFEAFSPDLSTETMALLLSIAAQEKLFVTAGSDYHGTMKKDRHLGVTNAPEKGMNMVRVFTKAVSPNGQ